jgi:Uma2 family endonuclease
MVQSISQLIDVTQFIEQYGDNDQYELIDGELVEMEATGQHEQVAALISRKINVEIERQNLSLFIPHRCLIKLLGTETAFRPDLIVLDQKQLIYEPLWQQEPVITLGTSIQLIAEIVSSNWQNDYARKVEDYALLGVAEYWIVDYLGLGGREYIGKVKRPTITICNLVGDEYKKTLFQDQDQLQSITFPSLNLRAEQVFTATKLISI